MLERFVEEKGLNLHLYWRQCDPNEQADARMNDDKPGFPGFGFAQANRARWAVVRNEWPVIDELLELGAGSYAELQGQRGRRTAFKLARAIREGKPTRFR